MPGLERTSTEPFEWHLVHIGYVLNGKFTTLPWVRKAGAGALRGLLGSRWLHKDSVSGILVRRMTRALLQGLLPGH